MQTTLIHSFSTSSFAGLSSSSRSQSAVNLSCQGQGLSTSTIGLVGDHEYRQYDDVIKENPEHKLPGTNNSSPNNKDNPDVEVSCCMSWAKATFRKKHALRQFPVLTWIRSYTLKTLIADFIAGLTVGLTILPQGLAYASIAQLPPQYGLYSGFVGCFVYILFGSSHAVTIGPTAIMSIITFSYCAGKGPEYAVLLSFLTGIITLLMGVFQMGFIVNFISLPVMSGFTSAAALTICSTQIKALLGLHYPAEGFLATIRGAIEHFSEVKSADALLSFGCIIVLIFLQKMQIIFKCCTKGHPQIEKTLWLISTSRSVIVIIICTIVFSVLGNPAIVDVVGTLVPGLPSLQFPPFSYTLQSNETVTEYTIAKLVKMDTSALIVLPLLALMEHITVAKAYARGSRVDASLELISIGFSNIIGSFFSSIPVTGSFSRSVVNAASGSQTPMGGLVTGALVLLALQYMTPYFYFIPKSSLAAVIVCAVLPTVDLDIIYPMWKSKKMDFIPWGVTFLVSIFIGLEFGILCGFIISVVFLLFYAARPGLRVNKGVTSSGLEFILLNLDRSLVFPSVDHTSYAVKKSGENWAKGYMPVVIDCQHLQFADYTAAQGVSNFFKAFNERKQALILWKIKPSILRILTTVMEIGSVEFRYCSTELELEMMLEAISVEALNEKSQDIRITFTVSGDEDCSSSANSSTASTPTTQSRGGSREVDDQKNNSTKTVDIAKL